MTTEGVLFGKGAYATLQDDNNLLAAPPILRDEEALQAQAMAGGAAAVAAPPILRDEEALQAQATARGAAAVATEALQFSEEEYQKALSDVVYQSCAVPDDSYSTLETYEGEDSISEHGNISQHAAIKALDKKIKHDDIAKLVSLFTHPGENFLRGLERLRTLIIRNNNGDSSATMPLVADALSYICSLRIRAMGAEAQRAHTDAQQQEQLAQAAKNQVTELRERILQLEGVGTDTDKLLQTARQELTQIRLENNTLANELEDNKVIQAKLGAELAAAQEELALIKVQNSKHFELDSDTLHEAEIQLKDLERQIQEKKQEIAPLKRKSKALEAQLEDTKTEINRLQKECSKHKSILAQTQDELQSTKEELIAFKSAHQTEVDTLETALKASEEALTQVKMELHKKEQAYLEIQSAFEPLQAQLKNHQGTHEEAESLRAALNQSLSDYNDALEELNTLRTRRDSLENKNKKLLELNEQSQLVTAENAALQDQIKDLKGCVQQIQSQSSKNQNEITLQESTEKDLTIRQQAEQIQQLTTQMNDLRKQVQKEIQHRVFTETQSNKKDTKLATVTSQLKELQDSKIEATMLKNRVQMLEASKKTAVNEVWKARAIMVGVIALGILAYVIAAYFSESTPEIEEVKVIEPPPAGWFERGLRYWGFIN